MEIKPDILQFDPKAHLQMLQKKYLEEEQSTPQNKLAKREGLINKFVYSISHGKYGQIMKAKKGT